jgi:UDP-N-acetylmuramoyl-tripeptide--D-alanyl-D-alanine ligase
MTARWLGSACSGSRQLKGRERTVSFVGNLARQVCGGTGLRAAGAALVDLVMSNMSAAEVASCTGGVLVSGSRTASVSGVSIDSRTLKQGDFFFAIRGSRNDGHRYIADVLARGAAGAVVASDYGVPPDFPADRALIHVADTHQALKALAAHLRSRWQGSLVAITGSMGKTTTKEFSAHVLQAAFTVYRSPGNYNNLFGLPLALCGLGSDDQIGIFEMGMSAPGEIAEMCRLAHPAVGIITNVAPVHLQFFSGVEEIARAKAELAAGLGFDGTLIFNLDDPLVASIASSFKGRKIGFGLAEAADVRAGDIELASLRETRFNVAVSGRSRPASVPFAGRHYVMNALAAVALGSHFGIDLDQIVASLRQLRQNPMRGQVLTFEDGFTVIDDSYNSNPRALKLMIETLCGLPGSGRRILVAGEMLELGQEADRLHYECGVCASKCGVDIVVAVCGTAREIVRGALESGMSAGNAYFFTEVEPATDFVTRAAKPGDIILVKGSRGTKLDRMIRSLKTSCGERTN